LFDIAAEPDKKPDARSIALDSDSAQTRVSQSVSPDDVDLGEQRPAVSVTKL
jgi:hypothetical protein